MFSLNNNVFSVYVSLTVFTKAYLRRNKIWAILHKLLSCMGLIVLKYNWFHQSTVFDSYRQQHKYFAKRNLREYQYIDSVSSQILAYPPYNLFHQYTTICTTHQE